MIACWAVCTPTVRDRFPLPKSDLAVNRWGGLTNRLTHSPGAECPRAHLHVRGRRGRGGAAAGGGARLVGRAGGARCAPLAALLQFNVSACAWAAGFSRGSPGADSDAFKQPPGALHYQRSEASAHPAHLSCAVGALGFARAGFRAAPGDTPDCFLGLLTVSDDVHVYGYVTNTRTRLLCAVAGGAANEEAMRAVSSMLRSSRAVLAYSTRVQQQRARRDCLLPEMCHRH